MSVRVGMHGQAGFRFGNRICRQEQGRDFRETMREKTGRKEELATSRLRVGAAIRERRLAAGLSLAELADLIGVALSTMSKIENGKISTSFGRLDSVSRALQADLSEVLGGGAPMAIAIQQ
jgi:ribosome-binding protein aMBF1 (putative translation factor)